MATTELTDVSRTFDSSVQFPSAMAKSSARSTRFLAAICAVLTLACIYFICLKPKPSSASDFFMASKIGQIILKSGSIPHSDPFSWTAKGQPWQVHGWLSDVAIHLIDTRLPAWMLLLYKGGLAALAIGLTLWRAMRRSGSWFMPAAVSLIAGFAVSKWSDVRPDMITLVFLSLLLIGLDLYAKGRARRMPFVLPPLFALWANLDSGAVIGFALVLLWIAGEIMSARDSKENLIAYRPLAIGMTISFIFIGLNPQGFNIYFHPLAGLSRAWTSRGNGEWVRPDLLSPGLRYFLLLLVATPVAMAMAGRRRGWRISDSLILMFTAVLGLAVGPYTALFAIVAAPVLSGSLAVIWNRFAQSRTSFTRGGAMSSICAVCFAVMLAALTVHEIPKAATSKWARQSFRNGDQPKAGAALLASGQYPGRLYNDSDWGAFLIRRAWPKREVFIDLRAGVYDASGAYKDHLTIETASPGWQNALDKWGVQVVLTSKKGKLARALQQSPQWRRTFWGFKESIFCRTESAPGKISLKAPTKGYS
jgi:hypothetical protein